MSHIAKIEMGIKNLDHVKKACQKLGLTFKENQKTYRWYGRYVGDYPLPDGITEDQLGHCDHAIGVPGANYEIGLIRKENGEYTLIYDFWHSGWLEFELGRGLARFKAAYQEIAVSDYAKQKGYTIHKTAKLVNKRPVREITLTKWR